MIIHLQIFSFANKVGTSTAGFLSTWNDWYSHSLLPAFHSASAIQSEELQQAINKQIFPVIFKWNLLHTIQVCVFPVWFLWKPSFLVSSELYLANWKVIGRLTMIDSQLTEGRAKELMAYVHKRTQSLSPSILTVVRSSHLHTHLPM